MVESLRPAIEEMRALAIGGLKRMYRPDEGLFAFRARRGVDGLVLEGASSRYTAIALIGLAGEQPEVAADVLGEGGTGRVCRRLIDGIGRVDNLGDTALTLWAALALKDDTAGRAFDRLIELRPVEGAHPTVELAWCLTALSIDPTFHVEHVGPARRIAERLMASFAPRSGIFPHWPTGVGKSILRGHVSCFADLVYPIQALAHYHARTGDEQALRVARQCAEHICAMQGGDGQWWWHYDVRTGDILEPYPVYAVHQDAMAPMALNALHEAAGGTYVAAIEGGVRWLLEPAELSRRARKENCPLIDNHWGVIWRKVARHEPGKLVRGLNSFCSRIHPALRVPGVDLLFKPGWIDYECRPYHLGWILHAWPGQGVSPIAMG